MREAEPLGAQAHLLDRLFAGNIDDADGRARRARAQTWMSSVDLPMPGSPPSSSTEPGTKPPPVTRSNSPMPVAMRGAGCARAAEIREGEDAAFARRARACAAMPAPEVSSTIEFQAPQASQRPCQRGATAPQFWQTKVVLTFGH